MVLEPMRRRVGRRIRSRGPLIGGVVTGLLALFTLWTVGRIGGYEAQRLLEGTLPTVRFMSSTTATASATIMALMLTMLSLTIGHDTEFREAHFERIRRIALYSTICLVSSILVLLILVVPLESSDEVSGTWYTVVYYVILGAASMLGGLIVAIMLMLYNAVVGIVQLEMPEVESFLVTDEDEDEEERDAAGGSSTRGSGERREEAAAGDPGGG